MCCRLGGVGILVLLGSMVYQHYAVDKGAYPSSCDCSCPLGMLLPSHSPSSLGCQTRAIMYCSSKSKAARVCSIAL